MKPNPPREVGEGFIPRTEIYNPDDLLVDLLDVAARTLVMGGRITYLLPTSGMYVQMNALSADATREPSRSILVWNG